jgi:hypothetical protein
MTEAIAQGIDGANILRVEIKRTAADLLLLKQKIIETPEADGEAVANVMLAYRHLEDASMRVGKVIQALGLATALGDQ